MEPNVVLALVLWIVWGMFWAIVLQTHPGKFLAARFTWFTVVVGVGVDLLIARLIIPSDYWLPLLAGVGLSSVPVIVRSLFNEFQDYRLMIRIRREHTDPPGQQDDLVD